MDKRSDMIQVNHKIKFKKSRFTISLAAEIYLWVAHHPYISSYSNKYRRPLNSPTFLEKTIL